MFMKIANDSSAYQHVKRLVVKRFAGVEIYVFL